MQSREKYDNISGTSEDCFAGDRVYSVRKGREKMEMLKLILTIIQVLTAVFVVVMVIMQTGKSNGLSSALGGGGNDTFLAKNKSRGLDAKLARGTKWMAAVFLVLTLVLNLL